MTKPTLSGAMLLLTSLCLLQSPVAQNRETPSTGGKIQLAILLDVSNSMDGLIQQAKDQLWNTVITFGKLRCNQQPVDFEIALYEYGRADNSAAKGYVKNISPFTRNLDTLYKLLNDLITNGGEEYCGQVLQTSLMELPWDSASSTYKTIFISGNEGFAQGGIDPKQACELATQKGVIVNTIYCGPRERGIKEFWNRGIQCGNGSFNCIDKDAKEFSVPTPYDEELVFLKAKFNETYIPYGKGGIEALGQMSGFDTVPITDVNNPNMIAKYIVVKTDPNLYNNSRWDLVDAFQKDSLILDKIDRKTLLPFLQEKTTAELKQFVLMKTQVRNKIRADIRENEKKKTSFLEEARKKAGIISEAQTLQKEMQKVITVQASRYNMKISNSD